MMKTTFLPTALEVQEGVIKEGGRYHGILECQEITPSEIYKMKFTESEEDDVRRICLGRQKWFCKRQYHKEHIRVTENDETSEVKVTIRIIPDSEGRIELRTLYEQADKAWRVISDLTDDPILRIKSSKSRTR